MKVIGNKVFILILLFFLGIFAITLLVRSSSDHDFLYHDDSGDAFDIIDTLD